MTVRFRLSIFQILIFILIFNAQVSLTQSQNESECLDLIRSQNIPSEIINMASNIIVGYRSTGTFEPIVILNSDSLTSSLNPIELPYRGQDLVSSYTVVELSPDHQKILQIFSDDTNDNDLILRVSSIVNGNIESVQLGGIQDVGVGPSWLNSQAILVSTNQSEGAIFSYTILSLETMTLDTLSFDLNAQPRPVEPQLSPDLVHLVFLGFEGGTARRIYVFSNDTQSSTPASNLLTDLFRLQWSPQGSYITFFSDFTNASFETATIVTSDGELLFTQELNYGDPVVYPRNEAIVWSPDERFIAYQSQSTTFRGQTGSITSVIEVESQDVVDICIPGNLFWSPDSQYAAIFLRTPRSVSPPNVVIGLFVIDMNTNELFEIPIDRMDEITLEVGWFDLMPDEN